MDLGLTCRILLVYYEPLMLLIATHIPLQMRRNSRAICDQSILVQCSCTHSSKFRSTVGIQYSTLCLPIPLCIHIFGQDLFRQVLWASTKTCSGTKEYKLGPVYNVIMRLRMSSIIYFAQLQCAGALCKQQDTVARRAWIQIS